MGEIFIETRDKAAMSANITAAQRATGIYPIDPSVIPDPTFAPSLLTHREDARVCNVVTATETPAAVLIFTAIVSEGFFCARYIWQRCVNQQE